MYPTDPVPAGHPRASERQAHKALASGAHGSRVKPSGAGPLSKGKGEKG